MVDRLPTRWQAFNRRAAARGAWPEGSVSRDELLGTRTSHSSVSTRDGWDSSNRGTVGSNTADLLQVAPVFSNAGSQFWRPHEAGVSASAGPAGGWAETYPSADVPALGPWQGDPFLAGRAAGQAAPARRDAAVPDPAASPFGGLEAAPGHPAGQFGANVGSPAHGAARANASEPVAGPPEVGAGRGPSSGRFRLSPKTAVVLGVVLGALLAMLLPGIGLAAGLQFGLMAGVVGGGALKVKQVVSARRGPVGPAVPLARGMTRPDADAAPRPQGPDRADAVQMFGPQVPAPVGDFRQLLNAQPAVATQPWQDIQANAGLGFGQGGAKHPVPSAPPYPTHTMS